MELSSPAQIELDRARPALLHLMHHHRPVGGIPEALVALADAYLRLNPGDAEVRTLRDGLIRNDADA